MWEEEDTGDHLDDLEQLEQTEITVLRSESRGRIRKKVFLYIDKYWFFAGIIIAILFAFIWPDLGRKGGYIRPEYTLKYGAISIIFLVSGLTLRTTELWKAIKYVKLHVVIQTLNLVFIPLFVFATIQLIQLVYDLGALGDGLIIMASVPTTVSSSVVLVKGAGGNEGAALFNASFGNLLGLVVTPLLLLLLLGTSESAPLGSVLLSLGLTVLLPIVVGQVIQCAFPVYVERAKKLINFGKLNNFILLLIIWSAFCDTFASDQSVNGGDLALVAALALIYHGIFLAVAFGVSGIPFFHFLRADRAAVVLVATQKTISLGIPLIQIIYEDDPDVGLKTLPLLIYHPSQLLIAALFLGRMQKWVQEESQLLNQEENLVE